MFRAEHELKKGINWGKRYYESVTDPNRVHRILAPRPRVLNALELAVESDVGPIDATAILSQLTEDVIDFNYSFQLYSYNVFV